MSPCARLRDRNWEVIFGGSLTTRSAACAAAPVAELSFSNCFSDAQVPGRHLNALLNAEDAVGVELDEACVNHHADCAYFSYSGPLPLPLNRAQLDGPLVNLYAHNLREGFH